MNKATRPTGNAKKIATVHGSDLEMKFIPDYVPVRLPSGRVVGVWGDALIRSHGGKFRPLAVGEMVTKGSVILTAQDGIVQIEPDHPVVRREPVHAPVAPVEASEGLGSVAPSLLYVERVKEVIPPAGYVFNAPESNAYQHPEMVRREPIKIADVSVSGGDVIEDAGFAVFKLHLSDPAAYQVKFDVSLVAGSATGGGVDFGPALQWSADGGATWVDGSVLVLPAGSTGALVRTPVIDDLLDEATESLGLLVRALDGPAEVVSPFATSNIVDNDAPPMILISSPVATNEAAGFVSFYVSLSSPSGLPVSVEYVTADASAVGGQDYSPVRGVLTFAPGELVKRVDVQITNDRVFEGEEAFLLRLSNPVNADLPVADGVATILDDGRGEIPVGVVLDNDAPRVVSVSDASNEEGRELDFTVRMSNPSLTETVVTVSLASLSAQVGVDVSGALQVSTDGGATFHAVTDGVVMVPPMAEGFILRALSLEDAIYERPEQVLLSVQSEYDSGVATAIGTIVDNEPMPVATIRGEVLVNEGVGTIVYTVTLSGTSSEQTSVRVVTQGASATSGADFAPVDQVLTFAPGETSKTVVVSITDDAKYEGLESFLVTLVDPVGVVAGPAVTTQIIDNGTGVGGVNDDTPTIAIDDIVVDEDAGHAVFTLTLSAPSFQLVVAQIEPRDVTATGAGVDYGTGFEFSRDGGATWQSSAVTFLPGEMTLLVRTPVIVDGMDEHNEFFRATATVLSGDVRNPSVTGQAEIIDMDPPPMLSIDSVVVNEGAGYVEFTVRLNTHSALPISVDYASSNGTATAGLDYSAVNGTLFFAPGVTSQTILVAIEDDTPLEISESFFLTLSSEVNAVVAVRQGLGTILDQGGGMGGNNDDTPAVYVDDMIVNEAAGVMTFTVSLSNMADVPVSINYATADGTALAGADYSSMAGTLTFAPGVSRMTVSVPIANDVVFERSEQFTINLSAPVNCTIFDGVGVGTILDDGTGLGGTDNDIPVLSIADVSVREDAGYAVFDVRLSNASVLVTTVSLALANGTALGGGVDYGVAMQVSTDAGATWVPAASATFAPGATSVLVRTPVIVDLIDEFSETFTLTATRTAGTTANAATVGIATILDATPAPLLTVNDLVVNEAAGTATLTVSLSAVSDKPITVSYTTADGTALAGVDYTTTSGTLTFAPGVTSQTVTVAIINDNLYEAVERMEVRIVDAGPTDVDGVRVTISDGIGQISIRDDGTGLGGTDNDTPSLAISSPTVREDAGYAVFTLTLSNPSVQPTAVGLTLSSGTATGGGVDYGPSLQVSTDAGVTWVPAASVTFAPGVTSVLARTPVTVDALDEAPTENFVLTGTVQSGAITTPVSSGVGTIIDIDPPVEIAIDNLVLNEDAGTATFTVSLSAVSGLPVSVGYATADGAALAGLDYTTVMGVLNFAPGVTSLTITVPVLDDAIFERSETFSVNLTLPVNSTIADGLGVAEIRDDGTGSGGVDNDTPVAVINDVTVNEAAGVAVFTVTLSNAATMPLSVSYASANGTALAGVDYTAVTGSLTFAPGETSKTISVAITNDVIYESSEAFSVNLSAPVNMIIGDGAGLGTIKDDGTGFGGTDNDTPTLSIADVSAPESSGFMVFDVRLSNPSAQATTVGLTLANGTALGGGVDYGAALQVSTDAGATWTAAASATFAAGATSVLVRTPLTADLLDEFDETFALTATRTAGVTVNAAATGNALIIDSDPAPGMSINDVTVNEAAGTATFTVTIDAVSAKTVSVNYASSNGTATAVSDYAAVAGSLTFAPGVTSQTITVAIVNDARLEISENFNIGLSAPVNATIVDGTGLGTIKDDGTGFGGTDNDTPAVSINDVTVNEAAGTVTFTVTLDRPSDVVGTIGFATANGTATAGADYTAAAGSLTFAAGVVSQTVTVAITNDVLFERSEDFVVNLSAPVNMTIADGAGVGTIKDDGTGIGGNNDDTPGITVSDMTVNEAAGVAVFTVTLSNAAAMAVTVNYATANGTALAGLDYTSTSGVLTFAAGQTTRTISVPILNDSIYEVSEAFALNLSAPVNAVIVDGVGAGTIKDDGTGLGGTDNDAPTLSIADISVAESAGYAVFDVRLSNASVLVTTVSLALANGTAIGGGVDYGAALQVSTDAGATWTAAASATFAPGATSVLVRTPVTADALDEFDETFALTATRTAGTTVNAATTGTATIVDVNVPPTVAVNDMTVNEAAGSVTFTVTLSTPSGKTVTVNYATADGTALAGADYTAASGLLTFAPGETTKTVTIAVTNDLIYERSEAFNLLLSAPVNVTVADGTGVATIKDDGTGAGGVDNDIPLLAVGNISVREDAGYAQFTVTLSNPSATAVPVSLALANGTALGGGVDYGAALQVSTDAGATWVAAAAVTFAPGATSVLVRTPVIVDNIDEPNETFTLTATAAAGDTSNTTAIGTATVLDIDPTPTLVINDLVVNEATGTATLTVTLSAVSGQTVTVDYSVAPGTALAGSDYTAVTGTLTFAPGTTTRSILVPITNDTVFEGSENFTVNLANVVNAIISDGTGLVIIKDDGTGTGGTNDDTPTLTVGNVTVLETAGFAVFTLGLSNASVQATTVSLALANGTATGGGVDYGAALQVSTDAGATWTAAASATFAPGATSVLVRTPVTADLLDEIDETFTLTATRTAGVTVNTAATGTATITDTTPPPNLSINDLVVNEATGNAVFTVTLDAASGKTVTVNFATANGTAGAGSDYTATSGTLTFAPGVTSQTVSVAILNDTVYEISENMSVVLSSAVNAAIADATGVAEIRDDGTGTGGTDNDRPGLSINDMTVNEAAGTVTFTVSMPTAAAVPVTVSYASANGTATAGADYTAVSGSLTFAPGVVSQTVTVTITNDTVFETSETFTINLSAPVNASLADGIGLGTIKDDGTGTGGVDNDTPTLAVNSVSVLESAGYLSFAVTLSNASTQATAVSLALTAGTATGGGVDYGPSLEVSTNAGVTWTAAASATIAAGATSVMVRTPVTNDLLDEVNETFTLTATRTAGTTVNASAIGTGTIIDNDAAPNMAINDVTVNESAGTATFTITLDAVSGKTVTANWATSNGTAASGSDYTSATGALTFAPGETTKTVTVSIVGDSVYESTETFNVTLSGAVNAALSKAIGVGTILDDDAPALTVTSVTTTEPGAALVFDSVTDFSGVQGTKGWSYGYYATAASGASFTPDTYDSGSNWWEESPTQAPWTLLWATGGHPSTSTGDHWSVRRWTSSVAGTAEFAIEYGLGGALGNTKVHVMVDGVEVFVATSATDLSSARIVAAVNVGSVIDFAIDANGADSSDSTIFTVQGHVTPTVAMTTPAVFSVDLSGASSVATTVNLALAAGTATAGDYAAATQVSLDNGATWANASSVTFAAGQTHALVRHNVNSDGIDEATETYSLTATTVAGATSNVSATGTGTILDVDMAPVLIINNVTVNEATGNAVFTVSMVGASQLPVTVNYASANGAATAGADYTATSGSLTFAPGETSKTVTIGIVNDGMYEPTEAFNVTLSGAVNAVLGNAIGVGAIIDDDAAPIAVSDSASGFNNVPLTGSVLSNDSDPNGDPISVTGFVVGGVFYLPGASSTIAGQGSIVVNANGSYVFTPASAYVGNVAQITYTLSDGWNTATSTLDIAMMASNAAPVVTQSAAYISEEGTKYGNPDSVGLPVDMTNLRIITGTLSVVDPEGGAVTIDLVPGSSDSAPIYYGVAGVASWISYDPTIFDPLSTTGTNSQRVNLFYDASYGAGISTLAPSKAIMLNYDGVPYISVTIDDGGNYRVILMADKSLLHPIAGAEDLLAIGVGVVVSDGVNTVTVPNSINLNIEDDSPAFAASNSIQVIRQGVTVYGDLPELGYCERLNVIGADNYMSRTISSVQVDGVTYSFSPNLGIASASGPASWSYSAGSLTVNTVSGGALVIRASDGSYSYKAPSGIPSDFSESLTYVVTDSDGDSASRSYSIAVSAASAMNVMSGTSADDNLIGTGGQDAIYGYAGWDTLSGGLGGDFIYGGTGKDSLYGGGGSDTFVWGSGEYANAEGVDYFSMQNRDFVRDFDVAAVAGGGDVIDLRGILVGESIAFGNVNDYIHIDTTAVPGRALVSLSSQGRFSGGVYVETSTSQAIDLVGGSLTAALGLAVSAASDQIVAAMIAQGKLLVDN